MTSTTSPHVETMRAFTALNLDVAAIRRLADTARRLRASAHAPEDGAVSWTAPTKMHVTLKFFGAIDLGLAPALVDALRPLAAGKSATRVRITGLTAFPSPEAARVLVADLDDPSLELSRLQDDVETVCESLGVPRDVRAYRPHVTLARTRAPLDVRAWFDAETIARARLPAADQLGDAFGTELLLFRSDLARSGAEYTPLFREVFTITRASRRSERPPKKAPAAAAEPSAADRISSLLPPAIASTLPKEDDWD